MPILYIKVMVDVANGRSVLNVYKMELTGSRIAEIANGTFEGECRGAAMALRRAAQKSCF